MQFTIIAVACVAFIGKTTAQDYELTTATSTLKDWNTTKDTFFSALSNGTVAVCGEDNVTVTSATYTEDGNTTSWKWVLNTDDSSCQNVLNTYIDGTNNATTARNGLHVALLENGFGAIEGFDIHTAEVVQCDAGSQLNATSKKCEPCGADEMSIAGGACGTTCPDGSAQKAGTKMCIAATVQCDAGSQMNATSKKCEPCGADEMSIAGGACGTTCPDGSAQKAGTKKCIAATAVLKKAYQLTTKEGTIKTWTAETKTHFLEGLTTGSGTVCKDEIIVHSTEYKDNSWTVNFGVKDNAPLCETFVAGVASEGIAAKGARFIWNNQLKDDGFGEIDSLREIRVDEKGNEITTWVNEENENDDDDTSSAASASMFAVLVAIALML